jgi:hypothetical protein
LAGGVAAIIPLIAEKYGAFFGSDGCWLVDSQGFGWQLGLFYVPQGIGISVTACMMLHIVYIVHKVKEASFALEKRTMACTYLQ